MINFAAKAETAEKDKQKFKKETYPELTLTEEPIKPLLGFDHVGHNVDKNLRTTAKNVNFDNLLKDGKQKVIRYPRNSSNVPIKRKLGILISQMVRVLDGSSDEAKALFGLIALATEFMLLEYRRKFIHTGLHRAISTRPKWKNLFSKQFFISGMASNCVNFIRSQNN